MLVSRKAAKFAKNLNLVTCAGNRCKKGGTYGAKNNCLSINRGLRRSQSVSTMLSAPEEHPVYRNRSYTAIGLHNLRIGILAPQVPPIINLFKGDFSETAICQLPTTTSPSMPA